MKAGILKVGSSTLSHIQEPHRSAAPSSETGLANLPTELLLMVMDHASASSTKGTVSVVARTCRRLFTIAQEYLAMESVLEFRARTFRETIHDPLLDRFLSGTMRRELLWRVREVSIEPGTSAILDAPGAESYWASLVEIVKRIPPGKLDTLRFVTPPPTRSPLAPAQMQLCCKTILSTQLRRILNLELDAYHIAQCGSSSAAIFCSVAGNTDTPSAGQIFSLRHFRLKFDRMDTAQPLVKRVCDVLCSKGSKLETLDLAAARKGNFELRASLLLVSYPQSLKTLCLTNQRLPGGEFRMALERLSVLETLTLNLCALWPNISTDMSKSRLSVKTLQVQLERPEDGPGVMSLLSALPKLERLALFEHDLPVPTLGQIIRVSCTIREILVHFQNLSEQETAVCRILDIWDNLEKRDRAIRQMSGIPTLENLAKVLGDGAWPALMAVTLREGRDLAECSCISGPFTTAQTILS